MTHDQIERLLELTASAVNELGNLVIETKRHNREMERLTITKPTYVKPENDLLSREWKSCYAARTGVSVTETKFPHLPLPRKLKPEWRVYCVNGNQIGSVFAETAFAAGQLAKVYYNPGATVGILPQADTTW